MIPQVAAQADMNVTIVESSDEFIQKCLLKIAKSIKFQVKKFSDQPKMMQKLIDDAFAKINPVEGLENCDLR